MTDGTRSLDRGLAVIEALARTGAMSLAQLHRATGLPKSTLRRLLATLIARRFVRRSLADGRYRVAVALPDFDADPAPRGMAVVADAALPHALDLTRAIGWPSDIHVRDGDAMRVIESTRTASPYLLYRGRVNRRVSHFASASGMACLAEMPRTEVDALIARTADDPFLGLARFGLSQESYHEELAATRKRGWGRRLPSYMGDTVHDDELLAIAVPLRLGGRPLGGLSIVWPRGFRAVAPFAAEHVPALTAAGAAAETDMARLTGV